MLFVFRPGQQPLHHQQHKAGEPGEDEDDGLVEADADEIQRKKVPTPPASAPGAGSLSPA